MRNIMRKFQYALASTALITIFVNTNAFAASSNDTAELKAEIQSIRKSYESRIADLEAKLSKLEKETSAQTTQPTPVAKSSSSRGKTDNIFNPSIGLILNGRYANFSKDASEVKGFGVGEEGLRKAEGLSLGESELNFSANVDDKFSGHLTAAIVSEDGEDALELEEAYIKTLPGSAIPSGLSLKAGRSLWKFGYLNEHHAHKDDFSDRPMPYRAFLNNSFNDDGVELSYILPTDFFSEIGGGTFRGDSFPGGSASGESSGSNSAYARIGGDITANQNWRLGASWLGTKTSGRLTNDDTLTFIGDNNIYGTDLRYTWAPTGNANEKEVTLQAEYMLRKENGTYNDSSAATGDIAFNEHASGWYAQATYKFMPSLRIGARYSMLESPDVPAGLIGSALDANGHNPQTYSLMTDWSNSEFSRVRLQYNREDLSRGNHDNQIILQYIMSIGAHGGHKY